MRIRETDPGMDPVLDTLEKLINGIRTSMFTVVLYSGSIDAKVGIEVGISVLADRPLLVFNLSPMPLPEKLVMASDMVVDTPWHKSDPVRFRAVMAQAISSFTSLIEARERASDTASKS